MLVVADDDARDAGEREPGNFERTLAGVLGAVEAVLEPDRRHLDREVRVVGEDRFPRVGVVTRHDPRVRTDTRPRICAAEGCNEVQIVLNGSRNLLDIALNHLTLGRAALYAAILKGSESSAFQSQIL